MSVGLTFFSQEPSGQGENSSVRQIHMHAHTYARTHMCLHTQAAALETAELRVAASARQVAPVAGSTILRVLFFVSDSPLLL